MIRARFAKLLFPAWAALLVAGPALAADPADPAPAADVEPAVPSLEGLYFDWSLYESQENGARFCWLSSGIERSSEAVPRRRQAFILITNRPAEGKRGEVSVNGGLPYEDGGAVLLTIGRKQFSLFVAGGTAWAADPDEPQILALIRHGATLVVTGRLKGGPTVTDTFSLRGFPTALAALDQSCKVAGAEPEPPVHRRKHGKKR